MIRRKSKCVECPYTNCKPARMSNDELAYARCTTPENFPCHMEDLYGLGDAMMCRGHWEVYKAAEKKGIAADESADERIDWNARTWSKTVTGMIAQGDTRR